MTTPSVVPFRVKVPNGAIEDLRTRLDLTRWPEAETTGDWRQGVRLDWLRDLAGYWAADYEWRRCEQRINAFPQYTTTIDDLEIHFIHRPSPVADAVPLLMTHGWPGSIVEFLDVIDALADPSQSAEGGPAFHVVCPSLPGFGFSARPSRTGWGPERVAAAWTRLMTRLGYERFFVQGGDWGAFVSTAMAERFPDRVAGVHVNMPVAPPDPATADDYTPAEQRALADIEQMSRTGRGYSAIQSTRPQTIGYALVDSPAALCAWITTSSGRGPITAETPTRRSRATRCSTTSASTGLRPPEPALAGSTGRACRPSRGTRSTGRFAISPSQPGSRYFQRKSSGRRAGGAKDTFMTSVTSTSPRGVAISLLSSSRNCLSTKSAGPFAQCGNYPITNSAVTGVRASRRRGW